MKRAILISSLFAGLIAFAPAPAQSAVSVDIHVGHRAPVVAFRREPRTYVIPSSDVYYVQGVQYDMFRFGGSWWINDGGYWFRSSNYRGPFVQVAFERVPRNVLMVPGRYHHQTRGYWQGDRNGNDGRWDGRNRDDDRGNGRGNGRGHGRGNGR